ncbi:MAG: ATP-dependent DNA helicase RecQ, partial [Cellulomonas sp.]|uniref:HRDC domain-containing protein n=1 Tax=Cellulomonas sp. TaxID=40001 RepID=UPI0017A280B3
RTVLLRHEAPKAARPPRAARTSRRGGAPAAVLGLDEGAAAIFERLRAWRAATAKEQGVPAYVVFHDATLREIATRVPATIAELGTVTGVGVTKRDKYGPDILAALAG